MHSPLDVIMWLMCIHKNICLPLPLSYKVFDLITVDRALAPAQWPSSPSLSKAYMHTHITHTHKILQPPLVVLWQMLSKTNAPCKGGLENK